MIHRMRGLWAFGATLLLTAQRSGQALAADQQLEFLAKHIDENAEGLAKTRSLVLAVSDMAEHTNDFVFGGLLYIGIGLIAGMLIGFVIQGNQIKAMNATIDDLKTQTAELRGRLTPNQS